MISYFNRYSGELEEEEVYGDGYLRWIYGSWTGKLALETVAKRWFFSRFYGWRMDRPGSREKVLPFLDRYGVNPEEFELPVQGFRTFNEFFYRRLKAESRPISNEPNSVVFPADGRHFGYPTISKMNGIWVKGENLSLSELLGDESLAAKYEDGSMVISRLCPLDYHRFHFPCDGLVSASRELPGPLYSVNPIALKDNIRIMCRNRRWITSLDLGSFGTVLIIPVGATCVGATEMTYKPEKQIQKGDEMGFFKFGGSSIITLFEPERIRLDEDLVNHSRDRIEVYARMGDRLGVFV
jgi:phosphatidylserine decarboxylase